MAQRLDMTRWDRNSLELELKKPPGPERVGKCVELLKGADVNEPDKVPEFDDREELSDPGIKPVATEADGNGATPSPIDGVTTGTPGVVLIPRVPESTVVTPAGDFNDCGGGATEWGRVLTPTTVPAPSTI